MKLQRSLSNLARSAMVVLLALLISVPQPCVTALARAASTVTVFGGITVSGGEQGVDFDVSTSPLLLTVKTSTPLTFSGTGQGSIKIASGVRANIVLAGLSLTSKSSAPTTAADRNSPIDLWPDSSLHITLADGTTNYVRTHLETQCAGIHVAETASLTIDDSVTNRLADGTHVEVDGGKIATAGTLLNGTKVEVGDELLKLSAANPGVLKVAGGYGCAAIGSGSMENAGLMVFDGGSIVACAWRGVAVNLDNPGAAGDADAPVSGNYYASAGAGIGAGCGGGATDMFFNAADIDAYGSYHGAGIGAPLRFEGGTTYNGGPRQPSALTTTPNSTCGNITINGGFLKARGFTHGNAFGGACDSAAAPGAKGKVIKVTGGTLLPTSPNRWDLGGNGGTVIVTGGSMRIAGMNKFQGDGPWSDESKTTKLTMVTIDMQKELQELNSQNSKISGWQLLVNGQPHSYGAPTMFDDGKLYLWLSDAYLKKDPETGKAARIEVRLNYVDPDGKEQRLEPLYVEDLGGTTGSTLKRYVNIDLDNEHLDPAARELVAAYFAKLNKHYDGLPLAGLELSAEEGHYISTDGLELIGKQLTDSTALEYSYQKLSEELDKNGDPIILDSGTSLPTDSGNQRIEIVSKQYANTSGMESYWGHRIRGNAEILPVNSVTKTEVATPVDVVVGSETKQYSVPTWAQGANSSVDFNTATMDCLVVPFDIASGTIPGTDQMSAATCKAPTGKVTLSLDGREVGESLGGVIHLERPASGDAAGTSATGDGMAQIKAVDGREHVVGYFKVTRSQLESWGLGPTSDNMHRVQVSYTSVTNPDAPKRGQAAQAEGQTTPLYEDSAYHNYYESSSEPAAVEIEMANPGLTLYSTLLKGSFDPAKDPKSYTAAQVTALQSTDPEVRMSYLGVKQNEDGTPATKPDGSLDTYLVDADYVAENGDHPAQQFVVASDYVGKGTHSVYLLTSSVGEVELTSSNPGVVSIERSDPNWLTNRRTQWQAGTNTYVVGAPIKVNGPGVTTVTATVKQTGAYDEAVRSFKIYSYPDLQEAPTIEARESVRNLSRKDGTVRPGDKLCYSTVFSNTKASSMYQNPIYELTVPADASLEALRVTMPGEASQTLTQGTDYTVTRNPLGGQTIQVKNLPALYGSQGVRFELEATVHNDVILPEHGTLTNLRSTSSTWGTYGIDFSHDANFPWDTRFDNVNGKPVGTPELPAAAAFADPLTELPATLPDGTSSTEADATKYLATKEGELLGTDELTAQAQELVEAAGITPEGTPVLKVERFDGLTWHEQGFSGADPFIALDKPASYLVTATWTQSDGTQVTSKILYVLRDLGSSGGDHDLVVVPEDPDPAAGELSVTKTWQNTTANAANRANREIVQVGDELTYTLTAANDKLGSIYYNAVIKDELPVGIDYIPGSIQVVCRQGAEKHVTLTQEDFSVDYNASSRVLYVNVGHLYGGESAQVTFKAVVTPERLSYNAPQSLRNVGRLFGTKPSDTIQDPRDPVGPDDPDDPDNPPVDPDDPTPDPNPAPITVVIPDPVPGPYGDDPQNPPADPTLDERQDEEPATVELEYTEYVRRVDALKQAAPEGEGTGDTGEPADPTPAGGDGDNDLAPTYVTRAELLDHLRAHALDDGYDLSADPDEMNLDAEHPVAVPAGQAVTQATGHEAADLTQVGKSHLTTTFKAADGTTVKATLHHIVWDETVPEEEQPTEDKPTPGSFKANTKVSEPVREGTITGAELLARAMDLAASRGLKLPAGVTAQQWKLERVDAEGNRTPIGPKDQVSIADPADYVFSVDYERPGDTPGGAAPLIGALTLGYKLFKTEAPASDPTGGTSGPVAPADPEEGDAQVTKVSHNLTAHEDGKVHVNDILGYTIAVANIGAETCCMYDVVVADDLPAGLAVVSGSMRLQLPDGAQVPVPDSAYNAETHKISVFGGMLKGGQSLQLTVEAAVMADAEGKDSGNHAVASYVKPSDSTTDTIFSTEKRPDPGTPASSEDFEGSILLDPTPAAYPDDRTDPVAPPLSDGTGNEPANADGTADGTGSLRVIPRTGDEGLTWLAPAAGLLAAAALAATGAVVWRRRS